MLCSSGFELYSRWVPLLTRFARSHTTLYNMVNLLLRDVILVNLGFHMCIHCLSMLNYSFSQALRTHRANQLSLSEVPTGEAD